MTAEPTIEGVPGTPFDAAVVVRRRRFASPDGAFAVLDCDREPEAVTSRRRGSGDEVVVVGPVGHLEQGERAHVVGTWDDDARFGMQVRARSAEPLGPDSEAALLLYLRRVRHVGAQRARRLLERYGSAALEEIDRDPRRAFRAVGLRGLRAEEAVRSWHGLRATRALQLLLAPLGLAWLVGRIHKAYGGEAVAMVRERPYELTSLFGVGFATADRLARGSGIAADSPERVAAALVHVLAEAEREGSTCLPAAELATRVSALLGGIAPDAALIASLVGDGLVVVDVDEGGVAWVYRAAIAALEVELAARVVELAASAPALAQASLGDGELVPAPEQLGAVQAAFAHRLSVITGGPGTGKTATIRMLCAAARAQKASVLLVAPTGRAARRMAEATREEAFTVHSALGWIPGEGPAHDADAPLDGDLLVVDETSMANLELLVAVLRAVGPRMHVVLVGDADQLAPVGAGKPFAELVAAGTAPVTRLERIFRQAAGSMIVVGAHAVRSGRAPEFGHAEGMRRDLFLIERRDPARALDEIVSLVAERLPAHYGVDPVDGVQVFAPVYKGPLGIDALNERLRDALNPGGAPVLGGRFRIGDKLMLSGRNLHELGLMNGTVLRLVEHRPDDEILAVAADGVVVPLPEEEAPRLQFAYACSVHKGQGIELPVAVLVAHPAAGAFFLRREMLYTAMTRARTATVVVGQRDVVERAARTPDTARRHSRLVERLAAA